jgi:hypothetical protein
MRISPVLIGHIACALSGALVGFLLGWGLHP